LRDDYLKTDHQGNAEQQVPICVKMPPPTDARPESDERRNDDDTTGKIEGHGAMTLNLLGTGKLLDESSNGSGFKNFSHLRA
jgi:hypothetical protein